MPLPPLLGYSDTGVASRLARMAAASKLAPLEAMQRNRGGPIAPPAPRGSGGGVGEVLQGMGNAVTEVSGAIKERRAADAELAKVDAARKFVIDYLGGGEDVPPAGEAGPVPASDGVGLPPLDRVMGQRPGQTPAQKWESPGSAAPEKTFPLGMSGDQVRMIRGLAESNPMAALKLLSGRAESHMSTGRLKASDLVPVIGDDGAPVLVKASDALGRTPVDNNPPGSSSGDYMTVFNPANRRQKTVLVGSDLAKSLINNGWVKGTPPKADQPGYKQRTRAINDSQMVFEVSQDDGATWSPVGDPYARGSDPTAALLNALFNPNAALDGGGSPTVPVAGGDGGSSPAAPPAPVPVSTPPASEPVPSMPGVGAPGMPGGAPASITPPGAPVPDGTPPVSASPPPAGSGEMSADEARAANIDRARAAVAAGRKSKAAIAEALRGAGIDPAVIPELEGY